MSLCLVIASTVNSTDVIITQNIPISGKLGNYTMYFKMKGDIGMAQSTNKERTRGLSQLRHAINMDTIPISLSDRTSLLVNTTKI